MNKRRKNHIIEVDSRMICGNTGFQHCHTGINQGINCKAVCQVIINTVVFNHVIPSAGVEHRREEPDSHLLGKTYSLADGAKALLIDVVIILAVEFISHTIDDVTHFVFINHNAGHNLTPRAEPKAVTGTGFDLFPVGVACGF